MKTYKIMSSTNPMFPEGMELPLPIEDIKIGDEVQFLTDLCVCTQDKGAIMLNRAKDRSNDKDFGAVYTLMEVEKEEVSPYPRKVTVDRLEDLRINKEVDLFFETKEIMISPTDRVTRAHGITYEALYEFLKQEWTMAGKVSGDEFPLELEEHNNLILWNEWKFAKGTVFFLKEGSFNRKIKLDNGNVRILDEF